MLGSPYFETEHYSPFGCSAGSGGNITLEFDENQHMASGSGKNIYFTSDKFLQDPNLNITGNAQQIHFKLNQVTVKYDPNTGDISKEGGASFYIMGMPEKGLSGNVQIYGVGDSSKFLDGNSAGFDLGNGLGPAGGLVLNLRYSNPDGQTEFELHIQAAVSMEDLDGDGDLELIYPTGIPVEVGESKESVVCLFGVIQGGGGIGILPNGRIIRIPPRGERIIAPVAAGLAEVARGLALRDLVRDSSDVEVREMVGRLGSAHKQLLRWSGVLG